MSSIVDHFKPMPKTIQIAIEIYKVILSSLIHKIKAAVMRGDWKLETIPR